MHVLLLEFAAIGRFHREVQFPFVKGFLLSRGVEVRWVRFGIEADVRARQDEAGMPLAPPDRSRLTEIVSESDCSHVLCNRFPSSTVVQALRGVNARVRAGHVDSGPPGPNRGTEGSEDSGNSEPIRLSTNALAHFLGLPRREGDTDASILEVEVPDFGWEPGNPASLSEPPLPFLLCGSECTYRKSLRTNPLFEGLDLAGCERTDGCSFCVRPREVERSGVDSGVDSVARFRRQLLALSKTHRPWEGRLAVRAVGEPILNNIEAIVGVLREVAIAPIDLLIDGRADRIVAAKDALRRALERIGETPHALHMSLVGIESFSDAELILLNKGTTFEDNFRVVELLLSLERDYPTSFEFRRYGGLSLLLFTPWTRLQDLSLNLAILRRCHLADFCGKTFTSRLRMYEVLPLFPMAVRDGLIVDRYRDPRFDTARRNLYDDEVPWRFADPAMEEVCSILIRLQDAPRGSEALSAAIDRLLPSRPDTASRLELAEAVVDEALLHPSATAEALLEGVARAWNASRNGTPKAGTDDAPGWVPPSLVAVAGGLKPVAWLEGGDVASRGWDAEDLLKFGPIVRRRQPLSGVPHEFFVGHDERVVMRAIELTDLMDRTRDDGQWQKAAVEFGVLLGYPACCSRAFCERPASVRSSYMWLYVQSRIEHSSPVAEVLNPGPEHVINYVPCSLRCEQTASRANRMVALLRETRAQETHMIAQSCRNPWLLFVDRQGDAVELITQHEPQGRFSYRGGLARGSNPLTARVLEGDEIEVSEQNLLVFRRGRVIASLGGRAFLWWHHAPVQQRLWRNMLSLRFAHRRPAPKGASRDEASSPGPEAHRWARLIARLLDIPSPSALDFHGFRVQSVTPEREDRVRIELRYENTSLALIAAPRTTDSAAYVHAGPLSIFHPHDVRIDTRRKQLAVRKLAAYLASATRRERSS